MEVFIIKVKATAFFAIFVTYTLIIFGGYVATSESGMGCGPEWPLCNGSVIPTLQGETLIEFAHRIIGLLLVILTAVLFIQIKKIYSDQSLLNAARWMISILTIQVLAGAVVVILDLPTIVVTFHLIVAMIFMVVLIWIYHRVHQTKKDAFSNKKKQKEIIDHLNLLMGLLLLTIGLGAFIKHQEYGLACAWLDCRNTWLPTTVPQILQTFHRLLALITATYLIVVTISVYITKEAETWIKKRLLVATVIVLFQLLSGVFTIMTLISIPWAVIHLAIGTLLFITIADTRVSLQAINTAPDKDHLFYPKDQIMKKGI